MRPIFGALYKVAGRVLAPPKTAVRITLWSDTGGVVASADENGQYEFRNVAPGPYEITAEGVMPPPTPVSPLSIYRKLTVEKDVAGFDLPLGHSPTLMFEIQDHKGRMLPSGAATIVARRRTLAGPGAIRDLKGHSEMLAAGIWELSVTAPPDMYVESIASGDRSGSDLASPPGWKAFSLLGSRSIRVVLSPAPAALRGRVTESGDPSVATSVFLEPVKVDTGEDLIGMKTTRTDSHGDYRFSGLPPGSYKLLSVLDLDQPEPLTMQSSAVRIVALKASVEVVQDLEAAP